MLYLECDIKKSELSGWNSIDESGNEFHPLNFTFDVTFDTLFSKYSIQGSKLI